MMVLCKRNIKNYSFGGLLGNRVRGHSFLRVQAFDVWPASRFWFYVFASFTLLKCWRFSPGFVLFFEKKKTKNIFSVYLFYLFSNYYFVLGHTHVPGAYSGLCSGICLQRECLQCCMSGFWATPSADGGGDWNLRGDFLWCSMGSWEQGHMSSNSL